MDFKVIDGIVELTKYFPDIDSDLIVLAFTGNRTDIKKKMRDRLLNRYGVNAILNYQSLEYYGDVILYTIINDFIKDKYGLDTESSILTAVKSALNSNAYFRKLSHSIMLCDTLFGLNEDMVLSKHNKCSDTVESMVGAIYFQYGMTKIPTIKRWFCEKFHIYRDIESLKIMAQLKPVKLEPLSSFVIRFNRKNKYFRIKSGKISKLVDTFGNQYAEFTEIPPGLILGESTIGTGIRPGVTPIRDILSISKLVKSPTGKPDKGRFTRPHTTLRKATPSNTVTIKKPATPTKSVIIKPTTMKRHSPTVSVNQPVPPTTKRPTTRRIVKTKTPKSSPLRPKSFVLDSVSFDNVQVGDFISCKKKCNGLVKNKKYEICGKTKGGILFHAERIRDIPRSCAAGKWHIYTA